MKNQLNRIHNLMKNCSSIKEFKEHIVNLSVDNIYNEQYDSLFDNLLEHGVLAAEYSSLPMYYFEKSISSGMKQDKDGSWYKA